MEDVRRVACLFSGQAVDLMPRPLFYKAATAVKAAGLTPDNPKPPTNLPLATDDWPFLYLKERTIPNDYVIVIGTLVAAAAMIIHFLRPRGGLTRTDAHFFFLGVGFLLMQTKSINDCALYFGTTWLVSLIVICGTLLMVLAANLIAMRTAKVGRWIYFPLLASLMIVAFVPKEFILSQRLEIRLAWSLLAAPLPIFFAGILFSTAFRSVQHASAAFGANLIGATVGGFCEYLSLIVGTSSLFYIVFAAYAASALFRPRSRD